MTLSKKLMVYNNELFSIINVISEEFKVMNKGVEGKDQELEVLLLNDAHLRTFQKFQKNVGRFIEKLHTIFIRLQSKKICQQIFQ